jgi:pyruvate dehydrogenase E2 component (dihydrolipoamide acetyltransferase)
VNARRAGNRALFFDRVDVGATVERQVDGGVALGAVTIRDADRKSCAAISEELSRAKQAQDPPPTRQGLAARAARLPDPSVEARRGWPAPAPGSWRGSGLR